MPNNCFVSFLVALSLLLVGDVARALGSTARACPRSAEVLNSQETIAQLKSGEPRTETISKGQVHTFSFNAGADQFAELIFEWQGIDLNVSVSDSTGKGLGSPILVSAPGPVSVLLKTEKSQEYKVNVTTFVRQKISGSYKLQLKLTPTLTLEDESRLTAQSLIAAARTAKALADQVEKYQQALLQVRKAHDAHGEAQIFILMGNAYRTAGDTKLAEENYKSAASIWKLRDYKRGQAYTNINLGVLFRQRLPQSAISNYSEAALLFEQISDRRGRADALLGQGFALMNIGRTAEALEVGSQSLALRRAEGDRLGEALALNMMGDGYRLLGDATKAMELYHEATRAVAGLDHPSLEAAIINGKALVNDDQSHWESAKLDYITVLKIYESILGKPLSACESNPPPQNSTCRAVRRVLINLGEAYNSLGNPQQGLAELKKSVTISDALGEPLGQGESRSHLGYAYFLLGEVTAAWDQYQQALKFQTAAQDDKGIALTFTLMGMVQVAKGQPKLALEQYQKAVPLLKKAGDKRALAITLDKLATAYLLGGNPTEASLNYAAALDIWRQIKDVDGEALTLYNMADAERQSGNLVVATRHSEAAIRLVESLRTRIANEKFRVSYLADKKAYYELDIDLRMQLGKLNSDNNSIATALHSNEKARARVLLEAVHDTFLKQAQSNHATKPKFAHLLERRNNLVSRLSAKAQARTQLLGGTDKQKDSIALLDNEIHKLTEELAQLDTEIRAERPRLAELTTPQPATVEQIQQQLDADTLLLEFALGEKRSYAWAVSINKVHGVELRPRQDIENVANRLLRALIAQKRYQPNETSVQQKTRLANAEKEYAEAAALLSEMVLKPVARHLGHKRLVIVADGALQLVPFAVLPDPKMSLTATNLQHATPPSHLISNYEIVLLPSASVLVLQRRELASRKRARLTLAVVADPVFDSDDERVVELTTRNKRPKRNEGKAASSDIASANTPVTVSKVDEAALHSALRDVGLDPNALSRLAKSGEEAAEISSIVPADQTFTALGFKANRATVTSGKLANYRYVHFATHGVLDLEHPELSGLVLSRFDEKGQPQDGYLRLYEIYNLNLPAELVVLSACQTGTGRQIRGEGLMALTRGFMYAGAARVVASLWKVDDAATAELMARFYKEMFTNGKRPAAALRDAQIALSKEKRWQSPYFWAGFVLQGEWR